MSGNLLIVDGEPMVYRALSRLLRTDGYAISHALNPTEGLQLLSERSFDVVLSDCMLPEANGGEFLSELRQRFPGTVRLALSGHADIGAAINAMNNGSIFKFLTKPWSSDGLRHLIREAFAECGAKCGAINGERDQTLNDETGWLDQARFLNQGLASLAGNMLVVAEWTNAATCLEHVDASYRQAIYKELAERIADVLDLKGALALIDQGTLACVAGDKKSPEQWHALNTELSKPIALGSDLIRGSFRFGLSHTQGTDLSTPLNQALIAAGDAAISGSNIYTKNLGGKIHHRRTLEADLRQAIERDELFYELQAQRSTQDQSVNRAESLLRWQHPRLGVISPMDVIDLAETSDLINEIGQWMAERCCQLIQKWTIDGDNTSRVALNVSPRQFLSGSIITDVRALVGAYKIEANRLVIEIPESCISSNPNECSSRLQSLANIGVRLTVDNFGAGHSTYETLSRLPLEALKIDRSLISELADERTAAYSLVHHIVQLAKSLSMVVVAEGVETQHQANLCAELGCGYVQGYAVSMPDSPQSYAQLRDGHTRLNRSKAF